jgi:hypothetical protein
MTLDEIIEKVAKLPASLHVRPLGVTTDDLKLLANYAKALAEAEKGLDHYSDHAHWNGVDSEAHIKDWYVADPVDSNGYDVAERTLQAISRIKEGRG